MGKGGDSVTSFREANFRNYIFLVQSCSSLHFPNCSQHLTSMVFTLVYHSQAVS